MFIGHYGVALAAKRVAPGTSLGTLVLGTQLIDLLWPLFLLLGLEHVRIDPGNTVVMPLDFYDYPITHSMLGCLGWAAVSGIIYRLLGGSARQAIVLGAVVFSHWILDAVVHRPDLPILPGGELRIGLGVWNSIPATLAIEFILLIGGAAIYFRSTRAISRNGTIGPWLLVGILSIIEVGNLFAPPPPSETALAIMALALWLFVWWGYRLDRSRPIR